MASFLELEQIATSNVMLAKITAAVAVQSDVIRLENGATANHANRLVWAKEALSSPQAMALRMTWAVLAANRTFTKAQIEGATDAAILSAVADAVDIFAGA